MFKLNPTTAIDGYKVDHRRQYPEGTETIFSNLTPRGTRRLNHTNEVVFALLQPFIKEFLIESWNTEFFQRPKTEVVKRFKRRIDAYLGPNEVGTKHIEDLHDLGYLPIKIMSLPEGTVYPLRVPGMVIWNTKPEFFWLTNYLETILSANIWAGCTSATTAFNYKRLFTKYALETVGNTDFVGWQGHDFSFRGMMGDRAAVMSGAAHLLAFTGTDTIPAIDYLEDFYGADCEKELIGGSVAATEHSVMCAGGMDNELGTFKRLINEIYPKGIVSIVSDSWDYWQVLTKFTVELKDDILRRGEADGTFSRVVFRPDTGDPVKVVIGDPDAPVGSPEYKGSIEVLWDVFGGTVTEQGYKVLNPKVGLIYGDSITYERALAILEGLKQKGFASTNLVLGIGSFTYQYVTRDTDQYAVKATFARVNGEDRPIFKAPKGDAMKKSAKGLTAVFKDENGKFYLKDEATWEEVLNCEFIPVFEDGVLQKEYTLQEVRDTLNSYL